MTTSMDRSNRTVRRAAPACTAIARRARWMAVLPLALALWGCDRTNAVEHAPDAIDSVDGEAAAPTTYLFDPAAMRTLEGYVLVVQPFQRMQGTRYGVRLRFDVEGERAYVYLAPQGFLEDLGLVFTPGDDVEVTGSLLGEPGQRVMIATEIVKDGKAFVLRDPEGHPAWR